MKNLSIDEKAKRYDEALKVAKNNYETIVQMDKDCTFAKEGIVNTFHHMFPELKESEDEKIKEEIKVILANTDLSQFALDYTLADMLKYLEKPADKVEPKFKIGDWIVKNDGSSINVDYICCKIIKVENGNYTIESIYGYKGYNTFETFEKDYHLWTIQDAKDGDVLATRYYILVFKEFLKNDGGISYCHYDFGDGNPQFIWSEDKNWYFGKKAIIHPATKEQRDTLMKAMFDAGYTFDFEKKELKKIEQNPTEWSAEDEEMINAIRTFIVCGNTGDIATSKGKMIIWLKSLKERYIWKPSDEQIKALEMALYTNMSRNDERYSVLSEFVAELKKLREE